MRNYQLDIYNKAYGTKRTELTKFEAMMIDWAIDNPDRFFVKHRKPEVVKLVIRYKFREGLMYDEVRERINVELGANYVATQSFKCIAQDFIKKLNKKGEIYGKHKFF